MCTYYELYLGLCEGLPHEAHHEAQLPPIDVPVTVLNIKPESKEIQIRSLNICFSGSLVLHINININNGFSFILNINELRKLLYLVVFDPNCDPNGEG